MTMPEALHALIAFARTRWGLRFADRAALERWQQARIARWMATTLPRAPFYARYRGVALADLPIVDKRQTLADFAAFNTRGLTLDDAIRAAQDGSTRDDDLSVGLSSGTRGPRGVFVTSARERATWAGILLAKTLSPALLRIVLSRRAPLRVAFFLRADSGLYRTLQGRRIDFRFFDLMRPVEGHLTSLQAMRPDVLVAPASVLAWLAAQSTAGRVALDPLRILSVAEVLEPDDAARIAQAFGRPVHQLYQCTEGFLAATCEHGTLHLNEEFVHIEPEWLDDDRTRFTPIVTDFTRTTQLVVRYRLDDVLRIRQRPCACGRVTRALEAIDGRADDVLWLRSVDGRPLAMFPDTVRHLLTTAGCSGDYRLEQHGSTLRLATHGDDARTSAAIRVVLDRGFGDAGLCLPQWETIPFDAGAPGDKRRRIRCVSRT